MTTCPKRKIPAPALARLCILSRLLEKLAHEGIRHISSIGIGEQLGVAAHNVRKDISHLGKEVGSTGSGYDVGRLRRFINDKLGALTPRNACVVGLGRLGAAVLGYERFGGSPISIVAGFDSNINRLDTIQTNVNVYPAHEIADVVRREHIELGVVAVPASAAREVTDRLIQGGVRGIVNFSPTVLRCESSGVCITNMDVLGELILLSVRISLGVAGDCRSRAVTVNKTVDRG